MAQIQSVDLCYTERNAEIAIFTLCFLEHTPSSSFRCHLTADKPFSCGGSSWPRWAFRTTLEASLTARKIHLILRSALERQDLLADPSKQCFEEPCPHSLIISLVLLIVTSQKSTPQGAFVPFIIVLLTQPFPAYYYSSYKASSCK